MHNRPHTPEAKSKISAARKGKGIQWKLPEKRIVKRLLNTDATVRSIASEYGCSDSTIKKILRRHTTKEQRMEIKLQKQARTLTGFKHPAAFGEKVRARTQGKANPFYGKRHSDEFRAEQSKRKTGVVHSLAQRIATSARHQGVSVEEWKGFVTTENERERKSNRFKVWRDAVFRRDDYTCQMCRKRGGVLHPHHIKPFAKYPKLRFEVSNGVTLCARPCHKQTIGREAEYERRFIELVHGGSD